MACALGAEILLQISFVIFWLQICNPVSFHVVEHVFCSIIVIISDPFIFVEAERFPQLFQFRVIFSLLVVSGYTIFNLLFRIIDLTAAKLSRADITPFGSGADEVGLR